MKLLAYGASSTGLAAGSTGTTARVASGGSGAPLLGGASYAALSTPAAAPVRQAASSANPNAGIGFATGGAQDIANFRENINQGYLPLPTDVTYGGVVKDYYFDTSSSSNTTSCTELFCPLYSAAMAPDPLLKNQTDTFLAVGLDSGLKASDVRRPPLNLVILVDISGSMSAPFNSYYYDTNGEQQQVPESERTAAKIDVAKDVVQGVLDKLGPQDRVSIVLFSDNACAPKPLSPVNCTDMTALKSAVKRDVVATASTNVAEGYDEATRQLKGCRACMEAGLANAENRILLITDAQPNAGDYSDTGLAARFKANAADNIFTTLVGVGVDFNTELVESISTTRGANYYSLHTPGEFKQRIADQFDYAVNPLVFDLSLQLDPASLSGSGGWKVLHVYGSPNDNDTSLSTSGKLIQINTLFPSPKTDEGIKGGVVLLRLQPPAGGANTPLKLTVTYTDRSGKAATSQRTVGLPAMKAGDGGVYQSSGVRKAVLLARYVDSLQDWLLSQWQTIDRCVGNKPCEPILVPPELCTVFPAMYCPVPVTTWGITQTSRGCELQRWLVPGSSILPPPLPVFPPLLGRWERKSQRLAVNADSKAAFSDFLPYMQAEVAALKDSTLNQEVDIVKKLAGM
ncbi:hypothetical protein N2152v2_009027 [Parachlorella kessleri]